MPLPVALNRSFLTPSARHLFLPWLLVLNSHLHQQTLAEIFADLATTVLFGRQGDELPGVLQKLIPELNADAGLGTVSRSPLRVKADGADGVQAPTWSSSSKASAKERSQAASVFWR